MSNLLKGLVLFFAFVFAYLGCTCNQPLPCICPTPTNLTVANVTPTSVKLTWNAAPAPASFLVRITELPAGPVTNDTTNLGEFTKTGLTPNTPYRAEVFRLCPCGQSEPASVEFRTTPIIITDDIIVQRENMPDNLNTILVNKEHITTGTSLNVWTYAIEEEFIKVTVNSRAFMVRKYVNTTSNAYNYLVFKADNSTSPISLSTQQSNSPTIGFESCTFYLTHNGVTQATGASTPIFEMYH